LSLTTAKFEDGLAKWNLSMSLSTGGLDEDEEDVTGDGYRFIGVLEGVTIAADLTGVAGMAKEETV